MRERYFKRFHYLRCVWLLLGPMMTWCVACSELPSRTDESTAPEPDSSSAPVESRGISEERIRALKSLGYFERKPTANPDDLSVTKKKEGAFGGLSLYSSRHEARAYLIDMEGKVLHTWSAKNEKPGWMHVEMLQNGDLLAIADFIINSSCIRGSRPTGRYLEPFTITAVCFLKKSFQ